MYHANVNVNLIVKNVPRIEIGITINVGASVKIKKKKKTLCVQKITLGILLYAVAKMLNI